MRRRPSRPAMRLFCTLLGLTVTACGPAPLTSTRSSPEDLVRAVMTAVERRDEASLRNLVLSEQEFRAHVWPSLPAARPERNLPFSYVWDDLRQKSDSSLATTLNEHGGRHYELISVRFEAPPTNYGPFRVYRDPIFVIRGASTGSREVRLTGSLIEKNGGWKVFSYLIDD